MTNIFQQQIIDTYYRDYKFFFSKPNVQGIAYGYKYTNGINTKQPSIHIFVNKKIAANCLPHNGLIPPLYKGIKTDVIETGNFTASGYSDINETLDTCTFNFNRCINNSFKFNSFENPPFIKRIRPIQPGYCLSVDNPREIVYSSGTFGYLVTDNEQVSTTYCLLSNNQAFADLNRAPIGTFVIQPARIFFGNPNTDVVARLLRYTPIKFSQTIPNNIQDFNTIDASIASYFNVGQVQLINPFIPVIGIPRGISSPALDESYQWTGCYTGHMTGTITSISAIIKVFYYISRTAWFKDITLGRSEDHNINDRGALVCDSNTNAMGLLFAFDNSEFMDLDCICDIRTILNTLNVTLLTI